MEFIKARRFGFWTERLSLVVMIPSVSIMPPVVIIPMISIMPPVINAIVPSMFWAIVGVFTAVVDIIPPEYTAGMFGYLLFDGGMLFEEFFHLFVFIEIFAVVDQLRVCL